MRKYLFAVLATLTAGVALAFTPVAHTNSYVRDGVTYVQRGGLGTADYVVTNVTMPTITYPVTSVNSKTGAVVLNASDVTALPDNSASLIANENFKTAVEAVSPPVELPSKWALANVTNATGGAVNAADVGAFKAQGNNYQIQAGGDGGLYWTSTSEDGVSLYLSNPLYPKSYGSMWIGGDASVSVSDDEGNGVALYNNGTLSIFTNNNYIGAWNAKFQHKSGTVALTDDIKTGNAAGIISDTHRLDADLNFYKATTNYLPWTISPSGLADSTLNWYQPFNAWVDDDDEYCLEYNNSTGKWMLEVNGTRYENFSSYSKNAVFLGGSAGGRYYSLRRDDKIYELGYDEKIGEVALKGSFVPTNRTVNGKSLASDITLTAADVSAVASNSEIRIEAGSTGIMLCNDGVYGAVNRGENYYETYTLDQTGLTLQVPPTIGGFRPLPILRSSRNPITGETVGGRVTTNSIFGRTETDSRETHYGIGMIGIADEIRTNTYYAITIPSKTGTMALDSDLTGYVPTTRKVNGQALTQDITIEGMTDNAVVWTNSTLKTKAGATVNAMDYEAMTNTVNAVKAEFYDEPLQVNWTVRMVNGEMKLYATTNVNMSTL